jgi:hypothetical protein
MTRWDVLTLAGRVERTVSGDRSKVMEPAEPLTFKMAFLSRRSAGEWDRVRAGPPTHKRHETGLQGVVV